MPSEDGQMDGWTDRKQDVIAVTLRLYVAARVNECLELEVWTFKHSLVHYFITI